MRKWVRVGGGAPVCKKSRVGGLLPGRLMPWAGVALPVRTDVLKGVDTSRWMGSSARGGEPVRVMP